jgi:hypothetical protein
MSAAVQRGVPGKISLRKVQNDINDDGARGVFDSIKLKCVVYQVKMPSRSLYTVSRGLNSTVGVAFDAVERCDAEMLCTL